MSQNSTTNYCSSCKRYRPQSLYIHPTRTIPYKSCSDCRARDIAKRVARKRSGLFGDVSRRSVPRTERNVTPIQHERARGGINELANNPLNSIRSEAETIIPNPTEALNAPPTVHEPTEPNHVTAVNEDSADPFAGPNDILSNNAEIDTPEVQLPATEARHPDIHQPEGQQAEVEMLDDPFLEEVAVDTLAPVHETTDPQTNTSPFIVSHPRPQWLLALPTHRNPSAAYISRYNPNMPPHTCGERRYMCIPCGAMHFGAERVKSSSLANPRFQTCCQEGKVAPEAYPETPAVMQRLWTSEDRDAKEFRRNALYYNQASAFTSFSYGRDDQLQRNGQHGGLWSFSNCFC